MSKTATNLSHELYDRARRVLPGGVSRNTIHRKPHPDYAAFGSGCCVTDIDGKKRVDFTNNTASLIHGHAHPVITAAVSEQLAKGTAFTMATEAELSLAEHMCSRSPSFEKIRFMNSGTEAVMGAIKAARAITGRPRIAKTEGAYHGTYDYAEVSQKPKPENWGEANRPNRVPVAQGTPTSALSDVIVVPFNDIERTIALLEENADSLSAVIIDPLPHRIGLIPATNEYIHAIREWTQKNGALFILDEVISFRMGYGGAQEWFDAEPDLIAMGKIIGGGFPVGAMAGKDEWMSVLDPTRGTLPFPYSGTFSANPITMSAGLAAMKMFDPTAVDRLNKLGNYARVKINESIAKSGVAACVTGAGSMFRVHLRESAPKDYRSTFQDSKETQKIRTLVDHLYDAGFMMISTCSAALSTPMTEAEIDALADAMEVGLKNIS